MLSFKCVWMGVREGVHLRREYGGVRGSDYPPVMARAMLSAARRPWLQDPAEERARMRHEDPARHWPASWRSPCPRETPATRYQVSMRNGLQLIDCYTFKNVIKVLLLVKCSRTLGEKAPIHVGSSQVSPTRPTGLPPRPGIAGGFARLVRSGGMEPGALVIEEW